MLYELCKFYFFLALDQTRLILIGGLSLDPFFMVDTQSFSKCRTIVGIDISNYRDDGVDLLISPGLNLTVLPRWIDSHIFVVGQGVCSHSSHKSQGAAHNDNDGVGRWI